MIKLKVHEKQMNIKLKDEFLMIFVIRLINSNLEKQLKLLAFDRFNPKM